MYFNCLLDKSTTVYCLFSFTNFSIILISIKQIEFIG